MFFQFSGNPSQRVAVGIFGVELELQRGWERVDTQELRGVGAHRSRLLFQGLIATDVVDVLGVRAVVEITTQQLSAVDTHVVA